MPTIKFKAALDLANQRITNLGTPTGANDAASKSYVDAAINGIDWKQAVRAAAVANVSIDAPGAGVDGVIMSGGDRVLLMNQDNAIENGIYVWNGPATPMARSADADEDADITGGLACTVTEGTINGDKAFLLITNGAITVGQTQLQFSPLAKGTYQAGDGLVLNDTTFAVAPGTGIVVGAGGVSVDANTVVRKAAANIGDGAATTLTFPHNLGTLDVTAQVVEIATGATVECDVRRPDANSVQITFPVAPAAAAYRLIVHG